MDKQKTKVLNYLKKTYCRLKPSKLAGVGVFAIRDIPKDTKLFSGLPDQKWLKFKIDELKILDKGILKMVDDFFVIEKDNTVYIPESGLDCLDMSFFVNHSKKPNLKIAYNKNDVVTFIANKKIKKGEELTASYSDYDYKY